MRIETAQRLSDLTEAFYAQVSASFSATRDTPWDGWSRVLDEVQLPGDASGYVRVLDLACGNLRFERFLADALGGGDSTLRIEALAHALGGDKPTARIEAFAYDSCDDLVDIGALAGVEVMYTHLDIAQALYAGDDLASRLGVQDCDLVVCFGFMHHLPLPEHRVLVLRALASCAAPGGTVAISFWQLSKSERLLNKAQVTTAMEAPRLGLHDLAPNDYLLGWQGEAGALRYCHDFTEAEIDALAQAASPIAREVMRFSADGKTGDLNRYLILRRA